MTRDFSKPPLRIAEQLELLKARGLIVPDDDAARFYLGEINYYRLAAYWLPFEADHASHQFQPGTTFDQVLSLYRFDRELRILLMDSIERIEVAVRTRWAYELAHQHGSHAHMDPSIAKSFSRWTANMVALQAEVERSRETFITHYRETYGSPELPPLWAVCEVMSLGLLSRWYSQLGPMATRRAIAGHFGMDQQHFEGVLEHLTYLRNLCAHHSRVWNRRLTKTLPLPKHKPPGLRSQMSVADPRALYNTLVLLLYLMDRISPGHHWRSKLLDLLAHYPVASVAHMGFPSDFRSKPIWHPEHRPMLTAGA